MLDPPGCFALVISEHFSILLTDGNEKLVYAHGRIYGDFSPKERFNFVFLGGKECVMVG